MDKSRKQISFDLDTELLKRYYPNKDWRQSYRDIKSFMLKKNFVWIQGSVYASNEKMHDFQISNMLEELSEQKKWINICMRDCRMSNISKEHNITYVFSEKVKDMKPFLQEQKKSILNKLETNKKKVEKQREKCSDSRSMER